MKKNRIGRSELEVSRLCLGTMTFGEQNSETQAHALLDRAVDGGINFIDTAEMYPVPPRAPTQAWTEQYLGSWLRRQARDKLVIATKETGPARGFDWIRGGPRIIASQLREAIEGSLARLGTDYVDLYQIHWPDRYVPMFGETDFDPTRLREAEPIRAQLRALDALVREGKVRYLGLSNETPWGLMQFLKLAESEGLARVVSIQNAYHLMNRTFEAGLAEVCHYEQIGLLPYSPLAFGLLSGKYLNAAPDSARLTQFPCFGRRYDKPNVREAVSAYVDIARQAGLSPATMAIAFVLRQPAAASVIIGATTLAQLDENLAAESVALDPAVLDAIDAVHARIPNPTP